MADQKAKKNRGERNSDRPNGKAWKRRVCGSRHSERNCPRCIAIYTAAHNTRVSAARARAGHPPKKPAE